MNNNWNNLVIKVSIFKSNLIQGNVESLGRDDHACADFKNGIFLTFGGYVNGSRVNEVVKFQYEGTSVNAKYLATEMGPSARASTSFAAYGN